MFLCFHSLLFSFLMWGLLHTLILVQWRAASDPELSLSYWASSSHFVSISQRLRVMGSLLIIVSVFIVTTVLVKVPLEPLPFFSITMVKIIIINCESVLFISLFVFLLILFVYQFVSLFNPAFGAVLQGSLFGMAGLLPASYTTPIMSGQGLAGTFAAFAMICAIASLINNSSTSHQ